MSPEEIDALIWLIRETATKRSLFMDTSCLDPERALKKMKDAENTLGDYVALHAEDVTKIIQAGRVLYAIEEEFPAQE